MKNSLSNIQHRREQIIRHLVLHPDTDVSTIARELSVSQATVRRDLDKLSEENILSRYYGGAKLLTKEIPEAFIELKDYFFMENEEILRGIAKQAASLICDNDVVFLNSSRTASFVIDYITGDNVTVVTNNILVPFRYYSSKSNINLILMGGEIRKNAVSITGGITRDGLSKIVANKCILGVRGISAEYGISSPELEESYVNQMMMEQTVGEIIIVTGGGKIGKKDIYYISPVDRISYLVTDSSAPADELEVLSQMGVRTILAG